MSLKDIRRRDAQYPDAPVQFAADRRELLRAVDSLLLMAEQISAQCKPDFAIDDEQRVDAIEKIVRGALRTIT